VVAVSLKKKIPPLAVQAIENLGPGDLVFLCIVDPAWAPDGEEVL
jgi:mannose-6-phosphate isomerase-like protein (cupin superfamily)